MVVEARRVSIGQREVELIIRRHDRAKNIKISCHMSGQQVMLTMPKRASVKTAMQFFEKSKDWIARHLPEVTQNVQFSHGGQFPYLGQFYTVNQNESKAFLAKSAFVDNVLHVRGDDVHWQTVEWLRHQAGIKLSELSRKMAAQLGVSINRITIKEIKSRWGSCSSQGNLNYSWRVIMAPEDIVEYLCAHEVSHLIEMNHSPRFWALVESLFPNHQAARKWLRTEGKALFKYDV